MRAFLTTTLALGLMATVACSGGDKPADPPPAAPLAAPPEPEKINAENADAAADALEKEIAGDAD